MIAVAVFWLLAMFALVACLLAAVRRLRRNTYTVRLLRVMRTAFIAGNAVNIAALIVCWSYLVGHLTDPAPFETGFCLGLLLAQLGGYMTWRQLVRNDAFFRDVLDPLIAIVHAAERAEDGSRP